MHWYVVHIAPCFFRFKTEDIVYTSGSKVVVRIRVVFYYSTSFGNKFGVMNFCARPPSPLRFPPRIQSVLEQILNSLPVVNRNDILPGILL